MDRVRTEEVCGRAGIERELANIVNQRVSKWFRHEERMDKDHMTVDDGSKWRAGTR